MKKWVTYGAGYEGNLCAFFVWSWTTFSPFLKGFESFLLFQERYESIVYALNKSWKANKKNPDSFSSHSLLSKALYQKY